MRLLLKQGAGRIGALLPKTLGGKMMFLTIFMVFLPILLMSYVVEVKGREALLTEKQGKLFAITYLLNQALQDSFSLYPDLPRAARIQALNHHLSAVTDAITQAFPNVAAGYYHKDLDAIITYAPQRQYGHTVGRAIAPDHPGRTVMATGAPLTKSGSQVRGNIMNAMAPIVRRGQVVGYIWANELSNDINQQTSAMDAGILSVISVGLIGSLLMIVVFSRRLGRDVDIIKDGLNRLPYDLNTKIPRLKGEMGGIAENINQLSYALRDARTLNELIVESAADGMISVDTRGKIIMCNPAALSITGYQRDELLGKHYKTLFENETFHSPLLDTLNRGVEHVGVEVDYPAKDRILQIKASSSQLRNNEGDIVGALVIFTDLTEQKEMQRHIAQAERLATLGELMAGVAHEIRNPLTAISGFVQYLREDETDTQRIEYITIILQEVRSINKVIEQLLEFARPHMHCYESIAINPVIAETLVLVQTNALNNRINFKVLLADGLPNIDADAGLLKQVILNLMINAVQAIPARGEIAISTGFYASNKVKIQITDTGTGIKPQARAKVFTPFFTTKPSGTGLGLSIAQRIVNDLSGDILLESEYMQGTTVTLIFPIQAINGINL